jgi:hypothetical protein
MTIIKTLNFHGIHNMINNMCIYIYMYTHTPYDTSDLTITRIMVFIRMIFI